MTSRLPKSIKENLKFLCVEVDSQLANLQKFFADPTLANARRIQDRSGYAYNLRTRIQTSCVNQLAKSKKRDSDRLALRGIEFVATDLERITELGRDCVESMNYVEDPACIQVASYKPMLARVRRGVELVEPAFIHNNSKQALEISQLQAKLETSCDHLTEDYMRALSKGKRTRDLTRGLFMVNNLRQMGRVLLHISESVISANLGQPVNFERYFSLQALVADLDDNDAGLQIEPIAETRSGSAISGITRAEGKAEEYVAIFKDGAKKKVKEERQGVKSWHQIYPGLAPKILSYKKSGQSAALLIEHLPGLTFEDILLNESQEKLDEALKYLTRTLKSVWKETQSDKPVSAHFLQQLKKRLGDVYKIHPEFMQGDMEICGMPIRSFDNLLGKADKLEEQLSAPFSVYIHGDFNVDNIIYDPIERRINFIDLHRSRYMDYVQDVSVFMVSNYRLQVLDAPFRRRILGVALAFYGDVKRFAKKSGDDTFEIRLALGLIRSLVTSTRFILDKSLANRMFLRARYLLELVLNTPPDKYTRFKIPMKEIFVD